MDPLSWLGSTVSPRACDRCHAQKLRCRRPWEGAPCNRCTKVGAVCTTGQFRSQRRRAKSARRADNAAPPAISAAASFDSAAGQLAHPPRYGHPLNHLPGPADRRFKRQTLPEDPYGVAGAAPHADRTASPLSVTSMPVLATTSAAGAGEAAAFFSGRTSPINGNRNGLPGFSEQQLGDFLAAAPPVPSAWDGTHDATMPLLPPAAVAATSSATAAPPPLPGTSSRPYHFSEPSQQHADQTSHDASALVERLFHLNSRIFAHEARVLDAVRKGCAGTCGAHMPVDETLTLSTALIDILDRMYALLLEQITAAALSSPHHPHHRPHHHLHHHHHHLLHYSPRGTAASSPRPPPNVTLIDNSSMLCIFSIYSRLLAVYDAIFAQLISPPCAAQRTSSSSASRPHSHQTTPISDLHLDDCSHQQPASPSACSGGIGIPDLSIGSFSLSSTSFLSSTPPSHALPLRSRVIALVADDTLVRVRDAVDRVHRAGYESGCLSPPPGSGSGSGAGAGNDKSAAGSPSGLLHVGGSHLREAHEGVSARIHAILSGEDGAMD